MTSPQPRLQSLDALRGLAALGVVLFHYIPYYDKLYGHHFALADSATGLLEFGRYGVHLFFIISGFVILMTLERTRHAGWFALARGVRLLPALWTGILLTFLMVHILGPADRAVSLPQAILNTTLLHEYLGQPHVDGAYWSLVVEVTFYAWIALLFFRLGQWRRIRWVITGWLMLSYAGVIWRSELSAPIDFWLKDLMFIKYAPLFFSGMILYRQYRQLQPDRFDQCLLALAIAHCLIAYKAPFNVFVLGCYGVFWLAVSGRLPWLANRPLLWLGSLSYSLYLVHQNIGYGIIGWAYAYGLPGPVGILLALGTAFALATLIHYRIEQPCLAWFRNRRAQRPSVAPQSCPG